MRDLFGICSENPHRCKHLNPDDGKKVYRNREDQRKERAFTQSRDSHGNAGQEKGAYKA